MYDFHQHSTISFLSNTIVYGWAFRWCQNLHLKNAFSSTAFDTVLTYPLKFDENMRQEITEIRDNTSNNSIFCPGCPALILWCHHHRSVFCPPSNHKNSSHEFLPFIFASKKLYNDLKRDCKRGEGSGSFFW